jgi:two-component system response regulator AtoC
MAPPFTPPRESAESLETLDSVVAAAERAHIRRALEYSGGNRTKAAALLRISLRSLQYKMKRHGVH